MNISVLGCGRWGSFIAWYLNKLNHNVTLYGRNSSNKMKKFMQERTNGLVTLDNKIELTTDLKKAIDTSKIIVVSISSQNFRALMKEISDFNLNEKIMVLCMKGIEAGSMN